MSEFSLLARGGYATVYRAVQDSVGREVAVKVENHRLDNDRDRRRFFREARASGRLSSHPHVVDLFDVGVTGEGHPYLIMELCDGSYLDRMNNAQLTAVEARDLGIRIADALVYAHECGVLHRDIKPANLLHSYFNSAVLADFGLAVLAEARDTAVTVEVMTPAYASPEMFRHSRPTPAVDIYALCATLYAVMQGRPPRWGEAGNPGLLTLMDLFSQPIPDLPGVPSPLLDVLRSGMDNEPTHRPSAQQLRDTLIALRLPGDDDAKPDAGRTVLGYGKARVRARGTAPAPRATSDGTPTGGGNSLRRLLWPFR
uniref:serine/threonine-protein kinase n=1 Tax=Pilimelia terevasa TaxID=53372 RepID=UPI003571021F